MHTATVGTLVRCPTDSVSNFDVWNQQFFNSASHTEYLFLL